MPISKKTIYNIIIAVLCVAAAISLYQGIRNGINDSQDFQWDAAKAFALKINPYDVSLYQDGMMPGYEFYRYYLQMEANQFPSLLMILLPVTVFEPLAARYVWLALNLVFTALMLYLLRKTFLRDIDIRVYIMLALLMIAGTPYRNQLGVGQHTLFSFSMFLAAVYFSEYREKRSTALTALALFLCYFKYTLTAPLALYFVYKKRYKELLISIGTHAVLTVVSAYWLNDSIINMILKPLKVSSKLLSEGGLDISALLNGSKIAYVLLLVIMAGLFILSVKLPEGYDNTLISVLTLWSLIITYHRTYDFFVIIIVSGMFAEITGLNCGKIIYKCINITGLKILYGIVIFMVFFFLRIFSENTFSKILTGGMYYAFLIVATCFAVLCMNFRPKHA